MRQGKNMYHHRISRKGYANLVVELDELIDKRKGALSTFGSQDVLTMALETPEHIEEDPRLLDQEQISSNKKKNKIQEQISSNNNKKKISLVKKKKKKLDPIADLHLKSKEEEDRSKRESTSHLLWHEEEEEEDLKAYPRLKSDRLKNSRKTRPNICVDLGSLEKSPVIRIEDERRARSVGNAVSELGDSQALKEKLAMATISVVKKGDSMVDGGRGEPEEIEFLSIENSEIREVLIQATVEEEKRKEAEFWVVNSDEDMILATLVADIKSTHSKGGVNGFCQWVRQQQN
ncbi:hypothetical protein QYF36_016718 [Acer negundo]|nr:hypothetical protein QYF36_016718 [Acer negundo]